jgi:hypothetical protein
MTPEEFDAAKKKAKDQLVFVTGLRDRAKDAAEAFPALQQTVELATYYSKVLDTMPAAIPDPPRIVVVDSLTASHQFYDANRERLERFELPIVASGLAFYASGSVLTYDSLSGLVTAQQNDIRTWATPIVAEYKQLQVQQNKSESVSRTLQKINANLEDEFNAAIKTYKKSIGGLAGKESAGIALRNVLENFKGEIHVKALLAAKASKPATQKLKWFEMAPLISKGPSETSQFISEESTYRSLHDRLTMIAKNRSTISNEDLEDIFVELIDHLFAVLNFVDPKFL